MVYIVNNGHFRILAESRVHRRNDSRTGNIVRRIELISLLGADGGRFDAIRNDQAAQRKTLGKIRNDQRLLHPIVNAVDRARDVRLHSHCVNAFFRTFAIR